MLDWAETAVHLAVAGGVFGGVFCVVLFPTRCLGWDQGLNWVSFWGISYLLLQSLLDNLEQYYKNWT